MKLYPRCKKVQIRIESGGKMHDSIESLRRHLVLSDIKPLIEGGQLKKWLEGINEHGIAERLPSNTEDLSLSSKAYWLSVMNALFGREESDIVTYYESQSQNKSLVEELWKYLLDKEAKKPYRRLDIDSIREGNWSTEELNKVSFEELKEESVSAETVFEVAKKLQSKKILRLAADKGNDEAKEIVNNINCYKWRSKTERKFRDSGESWEKVISNEWKRSKFYKSLEGEEERLKNFIDVAGWIIQYRGKEYDTRIYKTEIEHNIIPKLEQGYSQSSIIDTERTFLINLFKAKASGNHYYSSPPLNYKLEEFVDNKLIGFGRQDGYISPESYRKMSINDDVSKIPFRTFVAIILENMFNKEMYPKWREVEPYMKWDE